MSLARHPLTQQNETKTLICEMQVHFCQVSGCSDASDEISHNFCDVNKGMATMCTCKKSLSRLPMFQWPVQSHDCLIRAQTCLDMCNNQRSTPFEQLADCRQACADRIASSCGKPMQYGASYAVSKPGHAPSYLIVDQSQPQSAGTHVRPSVVSISAAALAAWLLV